MNRRGAMVMMTIGLGVALAIGVVVLAGRGGLRGGAAPWMLVAIVGLAAIVVAGVVATVSRRGAGERSASRAAGAERLGLDYRGAGDKNFRARFADLSQVPRGAKIKHLHEGAIDGRPMVAFESSYVVYTGQSAVQVSHTIYAVEIPAWPATRITPRNWFSRLFWKLGRRTGLQLDDLEFNLRFRVTTDSEDFAIALLSPDMQTFLLTKTNVRWRITPGRLCMIYSGTLKPDRMEASLQRLRRFWELVPAELEAW